MKQSWLLAGIVVVGATAWVLSGQLAATSEGRPEPRTAPAPRTATPALPAVRVIESTAEARPDVVRVLGHTAASRKVELRSETDGRIVELPVARGGIVAAGDVIARLATDDRNARLQESQALLRQRQAEWEAARQLNAKGHRSDTSLAEAMAKLDAARASVKRMEVELGQTVLRAPFEGVLDERPVELGSYAKLGDPIGIVVDLDPLRVVGFVAERDIAQLRAGMPAQAALSDGRVLEGTVTMVGVVADTRTRTFRVEIEGANPGNRIVEGLTAELRIAVGEVSTHRISPALLTLADDGRVGVKLVGAGDVIAFAPVQVIGNAADGAVLVAGLPDRATIVSVGQDYVAAGQKVRPVPAQPRPAEARSVVRE